MKKRILSLMLCLLLLLTFTACGEKEEGTADSKPAETTTKTDATTAEPETKTPESEPEAEQIVIEVAHMFAEGDPNTIAVEEGKKYIEEKSNGRITFKIYPNGTYGEQFNAIQAVRMGDLDVMCSGFGTEFVKEAGAIQGPYLFRDYDHWKKFKKSEVCNALVEKIEEAANYQIVGIGHFGFRQTILVKSATTPEEFSKVKLRVVNSPPYPEAATVLGASGTPIPITDVYMSIKTKVVDGSENPLPQIISMKFYEPAKYLIMTDHMLATQYWVASNKLYERLGEDGVKLFEETFDFIATRVEEINEAQEQENINFLKENGVTIITPNKEPFMERISLVLEKYPDWKEIYEAVAKL